MDDIALLQLESDTREQETVPPVVVLHSAEAATEATASESADDRYDRALVDLPVDVEAVLRWAREATWTGLDGPPDPGTMPGVMAFKRPPPRTFVPCGDGPTMPARRTVLGE